MFELIEKTLTGWLTGVVNGFNHTKCVSLSNQNVSLSLLLLI